MKLEVNHILQVSNTEGEKKAASNQLRHVWGNRSSKRTSSSTVANMMDAPSVADALNERILNASISSSENEHGFICDDANSLLDGVGSPARVQWQPQQSIKDCDDDEVSCGDVCASLAFD